MIAAAIVDHLRLCNWRIARGPPWGGFACRVPPHGYALGTPVASAEALPATIRYTRSPSVFSDSSLSPSFLRTTAARKVRAEFRPGRPLAFELQRRALRPAASDFVLLADAGLVGEPDFYLTRRSQQVYALIPKLADPDSCCALPRRDIHCKNARWSNGI